MKREFKQGIQTFIRENPDAREAFDAIVARGGSKDFAEEEIARALLGCTFEASRGMKNRLPSVLRAIRDGRTAAELFPDSLYDDSDE